MQVIILAAGTGSRLRPLTNTVPKVMVKVLGKEIILHQLELLSQLKNINEIIIVLGYKGELIKNLIGPIYKNIKITYVFNKDFDKTNNVYSLFLALKYISDNVLLVEGDVLFKKELLDKITRCSKNMIFVEKYKPYMDGCLVEIDPKTKRVKKLIPKRDQDEEFDRSNYYKTVNIYYFTHSFIEKVYKPSLQLYINSFGRKDYYELIIGSIIYLNLCKIYANIIKNELEWFEIDDLIDLSFAENIFLKKDIDFIKNKYGGYWNYDFIDYCYLYNLYFPNSPFIKEMMENVSVLIKTYPSGQEYIKLLMSSFFDFEIDLNKLFVGNGASEIIYILNNFVIDSVTVPVPTFNEYLNIKNNEKINYFIISEKNNFQIDVKKLVKEAKKTNFLLLINPNNPTGKLISKNDLIFLLENLKGLKGIILDESFVDFSEKTNTNMNLVEKYDNLIYIKSISKSYGVAGLRLGFVYTGNKKIVNVLKKHLPIWNINSFAEKFLEKFSKYRNNFKQSIIYTIKDRKKLINSLNKVPNLKVFRSDANFILCKILKKKMDANQLCKMLFNNDNIFIKDLSEKINPHFFRISVRKKEDNAKLLKALNKYLV